MKYLKSYNESLRDQMIPKSNVEVNDAIIKLMPKLKQTLGNYADTPVSVFVKVGEILKCDLNDLFIVFGGDSDIYKPLNDYFLSTVDETERVWASEYMDGDGTWYFYPNIQVARYIDKDSDQFDSIIFKKEYFLNNITNESIRDQMTPKSDEELLKTYYDVVQYIDNPLTEYPSKINPEFQRIADFFNLPKSKLHVISENDADYDLMHEYFSALTNSDPDPTIFLVKETENEHGGKWFCYPEVKIAHWSAEDFNEPGAWIFCKDYFENMELTESLRDQMRAKTDEEILDSVKGNINGAMMQQIDDGDMWSNDVDKSNVKMVKFLLKNGADPEYMNYAVLRYACTIGDERFVKELFNDYNVPVNASEGIALRTAAEYDFPLLLTYIIHEGGDVEHYGAEAAEYAIDQALNGERPIITDCVLILVKNGLSKNKIKNMLHHYFGDGGVNDVMEELDKKLERLNK